MQSEPDGVVIVDDRNADHASCMAVIAGGAAARERVEDDEQQERASDRDQPRADAEERADAADADSGRGQAAEQRSDDADGERAEHAAGLIALVERLCDGSGDEAKNVPSEDSHCALLWERV